MANYVKLSNGIYVGITTDTKPTNNTVPNGTICFEFATDYSKFTIYVNDGAAWNSQLAFAQSETNKTFDSTNTISSASSLPTVTVAKGGTGQTTATLGFDALSPMSSVGDLIVGSTAGTRIRLARGAADLPLKVNSGGTDIEYGALAIGGGGTGQTTASAAFDALSGLTAAGDLIIGGASGARSKLVIGTANQLLRTNSGATAPEWASTLSGLTLTSPIVNGAKVTDVGKVNTDSPYPITTTDDVVRCDASSGALIVTLPTAASVAGKTYTIRRTDILNTSNLVTVATTSSQTIGGAPNEYLVAGECLVVESDGTNWQVIARTPAIPNYLKGSTANRRYVAGALPGMTPVTGTSTTAPALDTLWAIPIVVPRTTKFDTITFRLTTNATSGGYARVGIYQDTGNCYPGALIFESGNIDTTAGAGKDTTITSGLQVFSAGLYWLAWQCRVAAPQIRILNGVAQSMSPLGSDNLATTNTGGYGYSVANASDSLPNPYTASATVLVATPGPTVPVPAIGLRPI